MGVKKNDDERGHEYDGDKSFLTWGGESQLLYERLRVVALSGGDTRPFEERGMSLFTPGYFKVPMPFCTVKRVRAPVRSGDFGLKELLLELRIVSITSQTSFKEACL